MLIFKEYLFVCLFFFFFSFWFSAWNIFRFSGETISRFSLWHNFYYVVNVLTRQNFSVWWNKSSNIFLNAKRKVKYIRWNKLLTVRQILVVYLRLHFLILTYTPRSVLRRYISFFFNSIARPLHNYFIISPLFCHVHQCASSLCLVSWPQLGSGYDTFTFSSTI